MKQFLIMLLLPFVAAADVDLVIDGQSVEDGRVEITTGDSGNDGGGSDPGDDPTPDPSQCDTSGGNITNINNFPPPSGRSFTLEMRPNTWQAYRFVADTSAGWLSSKNHTHAVNGPHIMSIAECPGDFSGDVGNSCVSRVTATNFIAWGDYSTACTLDPGETYYLSVKYTSCSASRCGSLFTWQRY